MIKGLYIHIPFCDQICTYCDFCKMVANDELKIEYMRALITEMEYFSDLVANVDTIYIGGGTPSSIDRDLLEPLLIELNNIVDFKKVKEFTFEANPCDISEELLKLLKKYHVNRISMGVQTVDEKLLKFLRRTHNLEVVNNAVDLIKQFDFSMNLDFLYAIPGQTIDQLNKDLSYIEKFSPSHISYYSLIVEDRTILSYLINNHKIADFSSDLAREFGEVVDKKLDNLGYIKYEFSNYAKPGYESLHNLHYWNLEEYLGIGLNASSQFNYTRVKNPKSIKEYIAGTKKNALNMHEIEDFNPKLEFLLMGLRKVAGISIKEYEKRIKKPLFEVYPILKKHLKNGLLEINDDNLKLSKNGVYLANQVFVDLLE